MEVEEQTVNSIKKEQVADSNGADDSAEELQEEPMEPSDLKSSATKHSICNGDSVENGTDNTVDIKENGVLTKNSDVDANSNVDSESAASPKGDDGEQEPSVDSPNQAEDMDQDSNDVDGDEVQDDKDGEKAEERSDDDVEGVEEVEHDKDEVCDVSGEKAEESGNDDVDAEMQDDEVCDVAGESGDNDVEGEEVDDKDVCDLSGENAEESGGNGHSTDVRAKSDEVNDSEKENKDSSKAVKEESGEVIPNDIKSDLNKDSNGDDVEIIGESKLIQINSPSVTTNPSQNVILMTSGINNFAGLNSLPVGSSNSFSTAVSAMSMPPGYLMNGTGGAQSPLSLLHQGPASAAPPKPKSSLDQIELIRWEIQNRLNTRPKYFKPNPSAELGPLAKFLFDIGSNLIKEAVYHDLVKIQSRKNDENTLSEKEKEDLEKLKDIERDLHSTIGHLKLKMKKRCKTCHFQTESGNVIYHHKQFPHEDNKTLHCAHCKFVTKQPMTFKFHIESEHGVQPRMHDKKAFYECDLCPYENNQEPKLTVHKQRCSKQFRPLFNLHPSCLSGAEINLCLENIFYKPVVPRNLKILQQKHAQQQAALAEARRQQAEVQALAAQKNAAALAAKRQQQRNIVPVTTPQRYTPPTRSFQSRPQGPTMPIVRYNSRTPTTPPVRPTVANMLKDKQHTRSSPHFQQAQQNSAPGGFEVCEICGGYVKDRKALRIHFFYAHRIDLPFNLFDRNQPPLYCATCYVRFWTAQGLRKHIDIHVQEKKIPDGFMGEGVHGKCISCGQLVGNIVVHMRVVHNREIHHYINALMCMFCGANFNSRPNVERHITDVHGTIDIATGAVKVKAKLKSSPQTRQSSGSQKKMGGGNKDSLVKGSVCVLCNLNFGRNVDLTRHCMRMHHTCMKCGMVVIDKASLLKHTCLSSPSGTRDCTMCSETGFHPAYYVKHLRDKHLRKFSITVARVSPPIIEKWIKRPYPFKAPEDVPVEISDSEDEVPPAEVEVTPPKIVNSKTDTDSSVPRKKVKIGPASKIGRQLLSEGDDAEESRTVERDESKTPPSASKRKMNVESTPERMSKRRK